MEESTVAYTAMDTSKSWLETVTSRFHLPQLPRGPPPPTKEPSEGSSTHTLLPKAKFTADELHLDERIRTLCLVIMALAVLAGAAYFLKNILIPFVLALALAYLLAPISKSCRSDLVALGTTHS
eukprot:5599034-Prymnesium_polylepis.1